ncbi:twin-arginine translocation signal domain-containing protein [Candidatus Halobonum tyrrellensis]|uniref:Uncharacterized protein n=1 Tax=Candidatus Halobonum tyrrellensis G22 TaxID=1324957 RepID=V4GSE6_9EURY|nr:twin-arginine translocation signal domain-containing protein [Candidatus Halobonum tyrrellensis]ESP88016.1 hypothetical protein K933_11176 [Candidatus Halobonum tyrrellensis G22]
MNRRTFLRGAVAAAAAATAGCGSGESGPAEGGATGTGPGESGDSGPTIGAVNRRDEPIDVSLSLWRLGEEGTSCDTEPETNGETAEASVDPGERADLLPVPGPGTYGMVFDADGDRSESCLDYTGSETGLTWVIESGSADFVVE